MSVLDFIKSRDYNIDLLFVDRFWNTIEYDQMIYIDAAMLEYIGYTDNRVRSQKSKYRELLERNFIEREDFIVYSNSKFREKYFDDKDKIKDNVDVLMLSTTDVLQANKTSHLVVTSACFQASLMMVRTKKGTQVRNYFITLNKIFREFVSHEAQAKINSVSSENEKLKSENAKLKAICDRNITTKIDNNKKIANRYLYVAATEDNLPNNIFKLGKCKSIYDRFLNYTRGYTDDSKLKPYKVIRVCHHNSLERYAFECLESYQMKMRSGNTNKEIYQVDFKVIEMIYDTIEEMDQKIVSSYNAFIENTMGDKHAVERMFNVNKQLTSTELPKPIALSDKTSVGDFVTRDEVNAYLAKTLDRSTQNESIADLEDEELEEKPAVPDHTIMTIPEPLFESDCEDEAAVDTLVDACEIPSVETNSDVADMHANKPQKLNTISANNNLSKIGIELLDEYVDATSSYNFRCTSIFRHEFRCTYANVIRMRDRGCRWCTKPFILDKTTIYRYDRDTFECIGRYSSIDELKSNFEHKHIQMIYKNIRNGQFLLTVLRSYFSILGPDETNRMSFRRERTSYEKRLISILEIERSIAQNSELLVATKETERIIGTNYTDLANKMNAAHPELFCDKSIMNRAKVRYAILNNRDIQGYRLQTE